MDDATLDAAACNCSLDIVISGAASWQIQSSQVAFQTTFFEDYFHQFHFDVDVEGIQGITAAFPP